MESLQSTFVAALKSVGTAATMATAGVYLHRRNLISPEGKKSLAKISQQVTIPALFFSKLIYCPQDSSEDACPNVADDLKNVWVLLFWPLYVVGLGLLVGEAAARISGTPPRQRRGVVAACAFANSTGLPVTLLSVIHANIPETFEIGRVDPNLFLSVYLVVYPVLTWGIGGWLLAAPDKPTGNSVGVSTNSKEDASGGLLRRSRQSGTIELTNHRQSSGQKGTDLVKSVDSDDEQDEKDMMDDTSLQYPDTGLPSDSDAANAGQDFESLLPSQDNIPSASQSIPAHPPLQTTVAKALSKALQPPVVGALLGLFIASFPALRGIFVDLEMRSGRAPMQWLFDGIFAVRSILGPQLLSMLGHYTCLERPMDHSPQWLFFSYALAYSLFVWDVLMYRSERRLSRSTCVSLV